MALTSFVVYWSVSNAFAPGDYWSILTERILTMSTKNPFAEQDASGLLQLPKAPASRARLIKKIDDAEKKLSENSGIMEGILEQLEEREKKRANGAGR
jgi:hypothetical protein